MSGDRPVSKTIEQAYVYQIQVQGRLDERWSGWFNGLTIRLEREDPPVTSLTGSIVDQASLRGILVRIWNLNLSLISLNRIEDGSPTSVQSSDSKATQYR